MKKLNTRSTLFILLVVASLASYIFLNTVTIEYTEEAQTNELELEEEEVQQNIILPDVQLLKKMIDTGKRFLPAS